MRWHHGSSSTSLQTMTSYCCVTEGCWSLIVSTEAVDTKDHAHCGADCSNNLQSLQFFKFPSYVSPYLVWGHFCHSVKLFCSPSFYSVFKNHNSQLFNLSFTINCHNWVLIDGYMNSDFSKSEVLEVLTGKFCEGPA